MISTIKLTLGWNNITLKTNAIFAMLEEKECYNIDI